MEIAMSKLFRLILALSVISLMGFAPLIQAEAPKAQTQVPGYYRLQLGQLRVHPNVFSNLRPNFSAIDGGKYASASLYPLTLN